MEPGRIFLLILDNASSQACEHYKTVLHGTVEFQPPCSPHLPSLQIFLEWAQNTTRSASSSCQSRRIAGTFDPRVSYIGRGQAVDVRQDGCCMGPQAEGLHSHQRWFFFWTVIKRLHIVPAQRHSAKTRHLTRHLTLHGSLHRHRQHLPARNGPPLILKWAPEPILASQKPKLGPWLGFCLNVPQMVENTV